MYDNILFGCSGVEVVVSPERETTSVGVGRALDAVPPRSRTRPAARPEKPVWGRTTVNSDKESGRKQHDRSRGRRRLRDTCMALQGGMEGERMMRSLKCGFGNAELVSRGMTTKHRMQLLSSLLSSLPSYSIINFFRAFDLRGESDIPRSLFSLCSSRNTKRIL